MPLVPEQHGANVASEVEAEWKSAFNAALSERWSREDRTFSRYNFSTGQNQPATQSGVDPVYTPTGAIDVPANFTDQSMPRAIAEACMLATKSACAKQAELTIQYILDNLTINITGAQVSASILTGPNTPSGPPLPPIPAAPIVVTNSTGGIL